MRFGRGIHHRRPADGSHALFDRIWKLGRQSERQPAEVGFVAAAGEGSIEFARPAHPLPNPADSFEFNLRGQLRARQGRELRIERRHQSLSQHSHVGGSRVHQTEIVGTGDMEALIDHLTADFVEHFGGVLAYFRKRIRERAVGALPGGKLHWTIRQGREESIDLVDEAVAETPARFRIEVEAHMSIRLQLQGKGSKRSIRNLRSNYWDLTTEDTEDTKKNRDSRGSTSLTPAISLCPPWLRFFPAAAAGRESHPEWCASRAATWPAGPRPRRRRPLAAYRRTTPGCSLHPFGGLLRRRAHALSIAVGSGGAAPRDHSIR